jgi:hypothetical protein
MPALREAIDAVLVCLLEMCHGFALCLVRFYITEPLLGLPWMHALFISFREEHRPGTLLAC